MILWTFADLLIIDVTVYGAGLSLEYVSLIKLRITEPDTYRPFKIPFGVSGLCILLILPLSVYFAALGGAFSASAETIKPAMFAILTLCIAEVVWQIIRWRKPGLY